MADESGSSVSSTIGKVVQYVAGVFQTIDGTEVFDPATKADVVGSVIQVVWGTNATATTSSTSTYIDTGVAVNITPKFATSEILVVVNLSFGVFSNSDAQGVAIRLLRNANVRYTLDRGGNFDGAGFIFAEPDANPLVGVGGIFNYGYIDNPATTSEILYKLQGRVKNTGAGKSAQFQPGNQLSTMIVMEIGR